MSAYTAYLAHEDEYRSLVSRFLAGSLPVTTFVDDYIVLWKRDRDAQWKRIHEGGAIPDREALLGAVLDRMFIACDAFDELSGEHTISEAELRKEVSDLARERWPHNDLT